MDSLAVSGGNNIMKARGREEAAPPWETDRHVERQMRNPGEKRKKLYSVSEKKGGMSPRAANHQNPGK